MGDPNLNGAQENLFGNYIIQRGLANPSLRDEILAQVANQVSSFFSTQCPNKTESLTVIAHFNLVTYFTLLSLLFTYSLLLHQVWRNPNILNSERGWLLLSSCLSAFLPSQRLTKYLLK